MNNMLMKADSYKLSHFNQYPEGTEHVYSYIEPRKGSNPVVILGINAFVKFISQPLTREMVEDLESNATLHGVPFNMEWYSVLDKYEGKKLPLQVFGVREGTVVAPGTPCAALVNTDPAFPWLTSYFETSFLRSVWYPSTVASNSRYCKQRIKEFMETTGADLEGLPFKLHDFGARGATCTEAAAIGGHGHLTQFLGTDTLEAIEYVKNNYGHDMAGFSIPATEHSTVTSWGREGERDMYKTFISNNLRSGTIAACVSDSYDIDEALELWKSLETEIKDSGGTLVVRPDSGDPVLTPVNVIERLMQLFGYETNDKGFRVLPSYIRVIQGDGITPDTMVRIMQMMVDKKMSIDNIAFGMGGGLLQSVNRDTYGFAMKCSAARVNGEWRDVYKDPKHGGKTSKKGLVTSLGKAEYTDADIFINNCLEWDGFTAYHDEVEDSWEAICARASI